MSGAYYNEIDKNAAAWLRELIKGGHIAEGEVDERDIRDVTPEDLRGFTQHHFFAGIGVWSYALRRAGWPDDRPVWTGSCPCQPFSAAGKRTGTADERHLWPDWFWLLGELRPDVIFGEQVASPDGLAWLDIVCHDLEASSYAVGTLNIPACGVGAPNIRQRTFWVAHPAGLARGLSGESRPEISEALGSGEAGGLVHAPGVRVGRRRVTENRGEGQERSTAPIRGAVFHEAPRSGSTGRVADTDGRARGQGSSDSRGSDQGSDAIAGPGLGRDGGARLPVNGFWGDAEWVLCIDNKWRAVEPSTFPLAHGAPARVGRLRGYGNAINAEAAAAFIGSYVAGNYR